MILFDIDDTLINHSQAEKEASIRFFADFKNDIPGYSTEAFVRTWHDTGLKHMESFLKGDISFQEQRRRRIRSLFQSNEITDEKADNIFGVYLKFYQGAWRLFDDVIEFFNMRYELEIAVLSDGSQEQQEMKLRNTKIFHHFKFVITAESERLSKPDPRFFLRACKLAGKPASDIYYVGDNLEKDALGANRAGLNGIWLNRAGHECKKKVASIRSLGDLRNIVNWKPGIRITS